jgi:hypothetical protein
MAASKELTEHEDLKQLAAMATLNEVTAAERERLEDHLKSCKACAETYRQYRLIVSEVMPIIGSQRDDLEDVERWTEGPWREKLFHRIQTGEERRPANENLRWNFVSNYLQRQSMAGISLTLIVAGISFFVGGKVLGRRSAEQRQIVASQPESPHVDKRESSEDQTAQNLPRRLDEQTAKVEELERYQTTQEQQLEKMRSDLQEVTKRESLLLSSAAASKAQLKELTEQRDALKGQIMTAEESYATMQSRLAALLSERDGALARNATLESRVAGLFSQVSDQERQIAEDEQYLNSDRDIRELMGARQLYIADVFDVDSHSRTRPPFGRIFYTHGKSLIFYAFDLDNQKNAPKASAFQVWGKGDDAKTPRSLGILYLDNESNRRWLLRSDDAEQLEKIDSVFVTVEPRGGSPKPTGKPFLYALLRKEANHP